MKYDLTNINTIKKILAKYDFTFSKKFGQNFLITQEIPERIAAESLDGIEYDKRGVIEIGPGIGCLTAHLCENAKKVISVEIDKKLIPVLKDTLSGYENLSVINGDILKIDINKLIEEEFDGMEVVVCANLPYYITTPIIMKLLESRAKIRSITVMVQKEVAKRLCAKSGSKDIGAVSLAVDLYAESRELFEVARANFIPSPNVDSMVIKLDMRNGLKVSVKSYDLLNKIIRAAYLQRRKTLVNALVNSSELNFDKNCITDVLNRCNLDINIRGEKLSLENFAQMSDIFYDMTN